MQLDQRDLIEEKDLNTLQKIEDSGLRLQEQGHLLEALECMERGLVLRNHFFGPDSLEVKQSCTAVGEMCNLLAMKNLEKNDYAITLELLRKAEILTKKDPLNLAVTYNNVACYHRKQGKLRTALQYLQKSLKIEDKLGKDVKNPADTYLNICAVLSQLGRHQSALEHAQSALIILHETVFKGDKSLDSINKNDDMAPLDRIAVLAIAYYNIGVEQEFLKKSACVQSYQKGSEVAHRFLGCNHSITKKLNKAYLSAQTKLEKNEKTLSHKKELVKKREQHNMRLTLKRMKSKWKNKTGGLT